MPSIEQTVADWFMATPYSLPRFVVEHLSLDDYVELDPFQHVQH
jgi:hypothetical protein